MNSLLITDLPLSPIRVLNVMFRTIKDAELVGTRTESAINPNSLISGMICSRAIAAPVDVGMILLNTDRFLRKSLSPAPGTESNIF